MAWSKSGRAIIVGHVLSSAVASVLFEGQPIRQLVATANVPAFTRVAAYPVEIVSDDDAGHEDTYAVSVYQEKLRGMSQQITTLQEELHTTKVEMESAERQAGKSEEQKARLRIEYERRLKETESRLSEMRRRQREQERAVKAAEASERKLDDRKAHTSIHKCRRKFKG